MVQKSRHLLPPFEAYQGDDPYVFISYAHKDAEKIYPLIRWLDSEGYRIWYDEGIDPGNEWPDEIANALDHCTYFIVFISPNAVVSKNVRNEINYAINDDKPFLAIHIDETELPGGLKLRISDIQAVMKYRMHDRLFQRKIQKTLPDLLKKRSEPFNDKDSAIKDKGYENKADEIYPWYAITQRTNTGENFEATCVNCLHRVSFDPRWREGPPDTCPKCNMKKSKINYIYLGRKIHEFYIKMAKEQGWSLNFGMEFDKLPETARKDNVAAAKRMHQIFLRVGLILTPTISAVKHNADGIKSIVEDNLERLAVYEHELWVEDKEREGWQYGNRDDSNKLHPAIIDWKSLPEREKDKDRDAVRNYIQVIESAGFSLIFTKDCTLEVKPL